MWLMICFFRIIHGLLFTVHTLKISSPTKAKFRDFLGVTYNWLFSTVKGTREMLILFCFWNFNRYFAHELAGLGLWVGLQGLTNIVRIQEIVSLTKFLSIPNYT
jgi:hypothetical protein